MATTVQWYDMTHGSIGKNKGAGWKQVLYGKIMVLVYLYELNQIFEFDHFWNKQAEFETPF